MKKWISIRLIEAESYNEAVNNCMNGYFVDFEPVSDRIIELTPDVETLINDRPLGS